MKILLATDGSAYSKAAVEEVARRPFPHNTKVRIVSVYQKIPLTTIVDPIMGSSLAAYDKIDTYVLKTAKNAIENAVKVLRKKNPALIITTTIIEGAPKNIIIEEAEKFRADLIVIGSHGYGAAERFILGSVSNAVSLNAKCSVEIVRLKYSGNFKTHENLTNKQNKKSKRKSAMKILVATDGSAYSKEAVENVAQRPFPPNTQVRVVSAYESFPFISAVGTMGVSQEYDADADRFALKAAENITESAAKILRKKNHTLIVSTMAIQGSPKSVLLEEAEKFDADLVVVGSHGSGVVERFLMGSVSHAVSLHAKCSVEIVRKKNTPVKKVLKKL